VLDRYKHWEPKQAIEMATAHAPVFEPGTSWAYSNTNYILLGLLIEAATGSPYAAELKARALAPLALSRTFAPGDEVTLPEPHAHGYFPADPELVDITDLNASQAWAAGELVSTADDLNRFYAGLLTGALLGPAELKQMLDHRQRTLRTRHRARPAAQRLGPLGPFRRHFRLPRR
jgi:D-alanyl-D-alanine carboxypeptidase